MLDVWRPGPGTCGGNGLDCGHDQAEERPDETYGALGDFFSQ